MISTARKEYSHNNTLLVLYELASSTDSHPPDSSDREENPLTPLLADSPATTTATHPPPTHSCLNFS